MKKQTKTRQYKSKAIIFLLFNHLQKFLIETALVTFNKMFLKSGMKPYLEKRIIWKTSLMKEPEAEAMVGEC